MSKTITGNWQLPNGSPVANGILYLSLSADAVLSSNAAIVAPKLVQVSLNASGSIPASTTILANDELNPANTQYTAVVNQAGGGRVWGPEVFSLFGASPLNLNTFTAVAAGGPNFPVNYPQPIVASPTASQTITGQNLSVTASIACKRLAGNLGSAMSASSIALSTGWGTGASLASFGGTDERGQLFISAGGSGLTGNPLVTVTFQDGAWPNAPFSMITRIDLSTPAAYWALQNSGTAAFTVAFVGTPGAGGVYGFAYFNIG